MLHMKKDMGGAASVLALAHMLMDRGTKIRLRVLIPAVENAISGAAFRPRDVYRSRKGLTVEIGNTDAEGRLILADAIALADEEAPELIADLATLTGAARVALGAEVPPFYTDDDKLASSLAQFGSSETIRSGACHCGIPTSSCLIPRLPTSTMSPPSASAAPSPPRCFCVDRYRAPRLGFTAISMRGIQRPSRAVPKAPSARARVRSMRCWSAIWLRQRPRALTRASLRRGVISRQASCSAVASARFVDGALYEVVAPQAPLRAAPSPEASLQTEALKGERITVYEINEEGWAWGQLESDGYVGYLPAGALHKPGAPPTHRVTALRTLIFPGPSIRLPPVESNAFGCLLAITRTEGPLAVTASGGYVPARHLAPVAAIEMDFVAVAERFVGSPYLWGGKTSFGLDCSGLVQIALAACGISCPRDSDMQEKAVGEPVADLPDVPSLRRADRFSGTAMSRSSATRLRSFMRMPSTCP